MIYVLSSSGSSGNLNFKVVQYTSTPTGTAAINTIGVVTDTAITSWIMSTERPANTEGAVWINVSTSSLAPFYIDKNQQIMLYPGGVKQYVSGAWMNKDAYLYQSGSWVKFANRALVLYNYGDTCDAETGGYTPTTTSGGTCTFNDDHILLNSPSNSTYSSTATAVTVNPIYISGYSEMAVTLSTTESGNDKATWSWGVLNQPTWHANNVVASGSVKVTQETAEFVVDISGVSGSCYIFVRSQGYYEQSYGSMNVYKIELR